MACLDYQIKLYDQDGRYIKDINDYVQLQLTRVKNDIGTLSIVLPSVGNSLNDFYCDYRAEVFRRNKLIGDTCWFLQRKEKQLDGQTETITLTFADAVDVLTRRVVAWVTGDPPEPQLLGMLQGPVDDICKVIMRSNFTDLVGTVIDPLVPPEAPGAITPIYTLGVPLIVPAMYTGLGTARQMYDLSVDGYAGAGVVITQEFSFVNVLETLQSLADASFAIPIEETYQHNLWFDIEYSPVTPTSSGAFVFKTWVGFRGNDLRNEVFIGPTYGNLNNATYIDDWSLKADICYTVYDSSTGSADPGGDRLDPISNSYFYNLPFGPVEIVTDVSTEDPGADELSGAALSALGEVSSTKSIEGTIVTSSDFDFMTHFNYGDILTMEWGDIHETVEIAEFTLDISPDGVESINIPLVIL
jgi:hypothetical protein